MFLICWLGSYAHKRKLSQSFKVHRAQMIFHYEPLLLGMVEVVVIVVVLLLLVLLLFSQLWAQDLGCILLVGRNGSQQSAPYFVFQSYFFPGPKLLTNQSYLSQYFFKELKKLPQHFFLNQSHHTKFTLVRGQQ